MLRELALGASNSAVTPHMINVCGMFLINVMCIGAFYMISEATSIYVWNAYGIFGFLYCAGLAYYLKGSSIHAIKVCSERTVQDDD